MLSATGLVKRYGDIRALDGFDLTVRAGEIAGLVGPNGAGKTTFIEVVTHLARPDSGRLVVGGIDALRAPRAARRLIGVSPQESALYAIATVRENLRLFGGLAGLRGGALHTAIDRVVEELLLADFLDRRVAVLSGGQHRRAQAATAMIGDPPLLLLDEPTAGADPLTRSALLRAVRDRSAHGTAVVYTTHYLPELTDLGATLAVAKQGRIVARGSQSDLLGSLPSTLRLRLDSPDLEVLPAALRGQAVVVDGELRISSTDPSADLAALFAAGAVLALSVQVERPDLDDLFASLTTRTTSHAH